MTPMLTLDETQTLVADVVNRVRQAVVATMGPNGKLGFISVGTGVKVTKDGVTVAKSIRFDDPRQELINRVITEAAIKTDTECGDGTTTTVMLTALLYDIFLAYPGYKDQKYIEELVGEIVEELKRVSISVDVGSDELYQLALTSSNQDHELASAVINIYKESTDRVPEIELKEGQLAVDKIVRSNGLPIKMHYSNPSFSKFGNGADSDFTGFFPVIIDAALGRDFDPTDALIKLAKKYADLSPGEKPTILLIARSIEHDVNSTLMSVNASPGALVKFVGVNTNFGGSIGTLLMQDIAAMFGAPTFQNVNDSPLVDIPKVTSTLTIGTGRSILKDVSPEITQALKQRANDIDQELGGYEMGDRYSVRAKFSEARARDLRGELVTIFVGGETYSDVKERVDRFEDVVKAVKSALANGVLPGVGVGLAAAGSLVLGTKVRELSVKESDPRVMIISAVATMCFKIHNHLMAQSALGSFESVQEAIWNGESNTDLLCFNLATGEKGTSIELGIYDTAFAVITALKGGLQTAKILANASSIILSDKLGAVKMR